MRNMQQHNPHRRSGVTMLVIAWALIFGGIYWFFNHTQSNAYNPNQNVNSSDAEVILKRNREGHYVAAGKINNEPVTFLLDTGATQVALSQDLASRLNLEKLAPVRVQTANGITHANATRLQSVRLGSIEIANVGALITPGMRGDTVLLGMSFLKQLEFTQRGEQLILRK